ncbi:DNA cytosine methyltransferase [Actinokineospora spheciospongiae]|uniref:DNA cytosine methyltransferase n=1 Tax=Actinokineospora spheciospongiae TaxID=909613 RepID=UPI000D94EC00|nr:DNA cytosine methyltransferase [Actinokineospora spheciospongiae]PWW53144.1 DNA (cytosine-5)-methyltransferase 1 [Actinokineospora spheciospongiae]
MNTRAHTTPRRSGCARVPAAVTSTTAGAGVGRATMAPAPRVIDAREPVVGSLCTGHGGLDLGVLAALGGGRIAWCADPDPHITTILAARMPAVPNLGDLRHIDWTSLTPVDVLTAGFPCQDISAAGTRAGIEKGARSGLWADIVAGLRLLRPALVVVENVAALRWRNGGLHRVLGDLAEAGYDAAWRSVRAADIGAAHRRERVFLLAWPRVSGTGRGHGHSVVEDRTRRLVERYLRRRAAQRPPGARPASAAANADSLRREELHAPDPGRWAVTAGHGAAVADTTGHRRHERLPRAARVQGRPDAALSDHQPAHPTTGRPRRRHLTAVPGPVVEPVGPPPAGSVNWGPYEAAVRRWEAVLGRPAPCPTQPGNHGRPVLAPAFVEHLMGLPSGWVTDLPLPRTAQLRALGNGVLPQQATHAVSLLLSDLAALIHTDHQPRTGQERAAA